jgi:aspartate/tyrosine/aromatic aminotransferase
MPLTMGHLSSGRSCADLKALWLGELEQMRQRVLQVRKNIAETEMRYFGRCAIGYLADQSGMFLLLPLTPPQETALTQRHGIHIVQGGSVNVARLAERDIPYLIRAFHDVTLDSQAQTRLAVSPKSAE